MFYNFIFLKFGCFFIIHFYPLTFIHISFYSFFHNKSIEALTNFLFYCHLSFTHPLSISFCLILLVTGLTSSGLDSSLIDPNLIRMVKIVYEN